MSVHQWLAATTFLSHILFLISDSSSTYYGLTYYVIPTPISQCPDSTQPCFILSQLVLDTDAYFWSNTTLIFEPGVHTLNSTSLEIGGLSSIQFIKSNLSLSVRIVCSNSNLYLYNITSVQISGLDFIGCSSKGESIGHLAIEDTNFFGQKNSITALKLIRSSVISKRTSFISNKITVSKLNGERNEPPNVATIHAGGAVALEESNVTLTDSTFTQNSAEVGGALFADNGSSMIIINSIFETNYATCLGNHTECYGGALYCQNGCTIMIKNSTFNSNSVVRNLYKKTFYGGAIAVQHSKIEISSCRFSSNFVLGYGGAIYIWESTVKISNSQFNNNTASESGGAIYAINQISTSTLNITRTDFSNSRAVSKGGSIYWASIHIDSQSLLILNESQFTANTAFAGGGIFIKNGRATITSVQFSSNNANQGGTVYAHESAALYIVESDVSDSRTNEGGAIHTLVSIVNISNCVLSRNRAQINGGVALFWKSTTSISASMIDDNDAKFDGGAFYVLMGAISVSWSVFAYNNAGYDGGAIHAFDTDIEVYKSNFTTNAAGREGGAVHIYSTAITEYVKVHIKKSTFNDNKADNGAAIIMRKVAIIVHSCDFIENKAGTGMLYVSESSINLSGNVIVANNIGSIFLFNSELNIAQRDTVEVYNNSSPDVSNETTIYQQGGAITSFQSAIILHGACTLMYNDAENGGAILSTESKWFVYGKLLIAHNTAGDSGGGMFLHQSELNCKDHCKSKLIDNSAIKKGGGIHAISSHIKVDDPGSSIYIISNNAVLGGGICLEMNAKLYILKLIENVWGFKYDKYAIFLSSNFAHYGGAIYVADETNSGICDSVSYGVHFTLTECSMQTLVLHTESSSNIAITVNFINNKAHISGSNLFGGLLDRCTVSPFAEVYNKRNPTIINGVAYLQILSTLNHSESSSISSHPVRVCFCRDGQPDYNLHSIHVKVKKGEVFKVPLVAVDQINHTVSATINIGLSSKLGGLSENQTSQQILNESCTNLTLSVSSPYEQEVLILYAKGPCKDAELSVGRIHVQFLQCICPIGFQSNYMKPTVCACDCDFKLNNIISECYQVNETLVREGTFWIAYLNISNSTDYEYLIHSQCPLNYCHPPTTRVYINLNVQNGSDEQCLFNRSGTLCGRCLPGFSLSLGSSRCVQCKGHWPLIFVVITITALLAGIALVALLLALNLTVAVGTTNGVIFYANIVYANHSTFFPFTEPNCISVFMAWLNLELGIDMCFFEGMDMYWKTLLQLLFPAYVIFLVVMVIVISERSTKFARLIGRKNPVATLDTLILLSYGKLIQTIITALSFAVLQYPNGKVEVVWLPDANIEYLHGKHAFLFLIAIIILLGGVVYTTILFLWQWLMQYQHKPFFKWVRYHRFQLFIEPYHAPYTFKHRYWTGLLLSIRVILYLASALNVSGAPAINLLVIGVIVFSLFVLKAALHGPIYRKVPIEVLELTCYVNIIILSFASFYTLETKRHQMVVAYISGSVTVSLFIVILIYHIFTEIVLICPKISLLKLKLGNERRKNSNSEDGVSLLNYQQADGNLPQPTVSWIDPPSHNQCEHPPIEPSNKETMQAL